MTRIASRSNRHFPALEIVGLGFIVLTAVTVISQLGSFTRARQMIPPGVIIGGVPVGGLSHTEAQAYIEQVYGAPISVMYGSQEIRLNPAQLGLRVESEAMLSRADEIRTEGTFWSGFWDFVWQRPDSSHQIDLQISYSQELLTAWLDEIAARYDRPPVPAQASLETVSYRPGTPGYSLDHEASAVLLDQALRRPVDRTINLVVRQEDAPLPGLDTLRDLTVQYLLSQQFRGVASIHIIDLESGREIKFNADLRQGAPNYIPCDIVYAGQSSMKLGIMVDFFRYLEGRPDPASDEYSILIETMVRSGDITANFMMQEIGNGNASQGAQHVTMMMHGLGLENSFIIAPYGDQRSPSDVYASTPAQLYSTPGYFALRDGSCLNSKPDYAMQTTVSDLAALMQMIYQCADFGGGGLIAAFPNEITQDECKMMVEILRENPDGIIMAGIPIDVPIAHKHGWGAPDTHNDAAIVYSPGGNYVMATIFWADEYLPATVDFPLIQQVSAFTFNYFNPGMEQVPRQGFNPELNITTEPSP